MGNGAAPEKSVPAPILDSTLAGGLAAQLFEKTGSWNYAFYGSSVLALCSALGAIGLLKMPCRRSAVGRPTT
jgi:hypothetical protein